MSLRLRFAVLMLAIFISLGSMAYYIAVRSVASADVSRFTYSFMEIGVIASLTVIILSWLFASSTLRPMVELSKAIHRISDGEFPRVIYRGKGELGELIRDFNLAVGYLESTIQKLSTLIQFSSTLINDIRKNDIPDKVCRVVVDLFNVRAAAAFLPIANGRFKVSVVFGEYSQLLSDLEIQPTPELNETLFSKGRGIISNDISSDRRFVNYDAIAAKNQFAKLMAAPLTVDGEVIGIVFALDRKDGSDFNYRDLELLETFTNQAALAANNERLYSELQTQLKHESLIRDQLIQSVK
ncbi:MAG: GAF domain-containing protein, partial [Candidatus Kryptoniota bacterium]